MRIISLHTFYKSNTHSRSKEWIFTIRFLASSPSRIAKNINVGRPESQPHVLQPAVALTFWTPNINIFRDPRWGRGQETYGEDPYLTGAIAVEFIKGIQGDDPNYMLAMACAKHYAVHSGPELDRHRFDAHPSDRDLYETYLPQFERVVREGRVAGVMSAYNALNGIPCSASSFLLNDLL